MIKKRRKMWEKMKNLLLTMKTGRISSNVRAGMFIGLFPY